MKTEQTIRVPDGWHEVTIGQFQELSNAGDNIIEKISILIDQDPEDVKRYDVTPMNQIISCLEWSNKLPEEANWKPIIEIDGEQYGFINRLSDLKLGEWIDIENYLKDSVNNMHKLMAMFYRPLVTAVNDKFRITLPYDTKDAEIRADLFKNKMCLADCYGSLVFFSLIENECIKTIQDYFLDQMIQSTKPNQKKRKGWLKKRKVLSGLGSRLLTPWQKEMLRKWKIYLTLTLYSPSISNHSK